MPQIIAAGPQDAGQMAEIRAAAWRAAYPGLIPDEYLAAIDTSALAGLFVQNMALPGWEYFLVGLGGQPAGFFTLHPSPDSDAAKTDGELGSIYFLPAFWGRGCTGPAMDFATARLAARGFETMRIWVFEGNARARGYYQKHGFCPDGAQKIMSFGAPLRVLRYSKGLAKRPL